MTLLLLLELLDKLLLNAVVLDAIALELTVHCDRRVLLSGLLLLLLRLTRIVPGRVHFALLKESVLLACARAFDVN